MFKNQSEILIYKVFDFSRGKEVYFSGNNSFTPEIVSGRNFSQDDFKSGSNTALVEESYVDKCINKNNSKFLIHNNQEYKVIGIYKNPDKVINSNCRYYVNLTYKSDKASINGLYLLDKIKSRDDIKSSLSIIKDIESNIIKNEVSFSNSVNILFSNLGLVIIILVITVLLVLLNIFSCITNWIDSRRKELSIKRLVGATNGKIINQILLDYILLQSISFLAGITISFILLKVKIFIFLPDNIDFLSVLISFIICLLIGFATVIKCLRKFLKNQAIGLRG